MRRKNTYKCYNKQELLASKKYMDKRDILNIILKNDETYTFKDVDKKINAFLRKEVNLWL